MLQPQKLQLNVTRLEKTPCKTDREDSVQLREQQIMHQTGRTFQISNPTNEEIAISGASSPSDARATSPIPTHDMPAARADWNPATESSNMALDLA